MPDPAANGFDPAGVKCVIADDLRFKQKLCIGEEAFSFLRAKNRLFEFWDAIGMGAGGAALAKSSVVAGALAAPAAPAGVLGWLGLAAPAAAVTPAGWVIAAAVVTGGGYYAVSRWIADGPSNFVDTIPKYITTPIDVLGTRLMDLLGGLAIRVSMIDGRIDPAEINLIADHFVTDWGFDRAYVTSALDWLASRADGMRVKALAAELAQFQASNPDCNASAMQAELMTFLRELVQSDGVIDEREELALEAIDRVFSEERAFTLEKAGTSIRNLSGDIVSGASVAATAARSYAAGAAGKARNLFRKSEA